MYDHYQVNWLASDAFGPLSQTTGYKACAVRIEKPKTSDYE